MQTISEIQGLLADRKRHRSSVSVPADSLRLDEAGRLCVEGKALALSDEAAEKLAGWTGVPGAFFVTCDGGERAYLFNRRIAQTEWCAKRPDNIGVIIQGEEDVVGVVDASLTYLSSSDVLEAALEAKPDRIDETELDVVRFKLNGKLEISIVSSEQTEGRRVGDIVQAGIDICHADTGTTATRIESYLHRLACSNGMLVKVCRHEATGLRRIRRAGAGNEVLTLSRIDEISRSAWRELDAKMSAVRLLAEERLDKNAELIRSIGEKLRFPEKLVNEIVKALDADEIGSSGTLWDVVCAVSRVGTHAERLNTNTRRYLQEISGDLIWERVNCCPTCGRVDTRGMRYFPRR